MTSAIRCTPARATAADISWAPGAALPPLLLDPDEAVAMAVCLRLAAGGSVAGVGESALRALSKLDQVMPARLRSQVAAVHDATVTLTSPSVGLTRRTRRTDDAGAGLPRPRARHHGYVDRAGSATERRLEPYQLVTTGGAGICWPTTAIARTGAACGWTG